MKNILSGGRRRTSREERGSVAPYICLCVCALTHFKPVASTLVNPPDNRSPSTRAAGFHLQGWQIYYSAWQGAPQGDQNLCLIECWHFRFTHTRSYMQTDYLTGWDYYGARIPSKSNSGSLRVRFNVAYMWQKSTFGTADSHFLKVISSWQDTWCRSSLWVFLSCIR